MDVRKLLVTVAFAGAMTATFVAANSTSLIATYKNNYFKKAEKLIF